MTRHFCDQCGKEIQLPGNDYASSHLVFGRTDPGIENGWRIDWTVRTEWQGKPTDLCAACLMELVRKAVNEREANHAAK